MFKIFKRYKIKIGSISIIFLLFYFLFFPFRGDATDVVYSWAKNMGGTGGEIGYSVTYDASGNVYTTGYFSGTADFDPGAGTSNLTSNGNHDIFISKLDSTGAFSWAKSIGGVSADRGHSITYDGTGNVYITGYYNGTVDFDPGAGTSNLVSNFSEDIFVLKLDSSGTFVWAKSMGGISADRGNGIFYDTGGNVYTTGYFSDTVDFDPGAGTSNLVSAGGDDIFISKLDSSGNFVWAKNMGGASGDTGNSIYYDSSGNVYSTGYFNGTADFDPGAGTSNLVSAGGSDIFISKLDSSGNFVWAKSIGASSTDIGNSITYDASGNVYTTGYFNGTADFDPGAGTSNLTSAGGDDVFVSKLDSSGNFVWAKNMGGTSGDVGNSITYDASGNVYTIGYFYSTGDFDPGAGTSNLTSAGSSDIFISKLDSSGTFVWAKRIGGTSIDIGQSIAYDSSGNIYTTGYFLVTVDFDPGSGTSNLTSNGGGDVFVTKFIPDTVAPVISETTPVPTPANDTTPNYTFTTDEGGTITYGGSCSSATTTATSGANTITFTALASGTYSNCTIRVTDISSNQSNLLAVTSFTIDATAPVISETTPVTTPTGDTTPSYTFTTSEAGTITYGGSCSSATTAATLGANTITFASLVAGTYSDCTITVTDTVGNASNILAVTTFIIIPTPSGVSYPTINIFTATPNVVAYNGSTTLAWTVSTATTCTASGGWTGTKATTSGSEIISNLTINPTSFTLNCINGQDSVFDQKTISVEVGENPNPVEVLPPSIVSFTSTPNVIAYNGSTTLSWEVSNATSCTASGGWTGAKAVPSGTEVISNLTTNPTSFTLNCIGAEGTTPDEEIITVSVSEEVQTLSPQIVSLTATPNIIAYNGSTTLAWTVANATTCTASGNWFGNKNPQSGTQTFSNIIGTSKIFNLHCVGAVGTSPDDASVSISINPALPDEVDPAIDVVDNGGDDTSGPDSAGGGGDTGGDAESVDTGNPVPFVDSVLPGDVLSEFSEIKEKIKNILETKEGDTIQKTVAVSGLAIGSFFVIASTLFATPLSSSELFLIPFRLWSLLMSAFGIKKKIRRWGVVYDSITKQPIDPAYVILKDLEGKEIATTITDIDGRYGFLVSPGTYSIVASKTNYHFPSQKLAGKYSDELYNNIYWGDYFLVKEEGEVIDKNIPLDPVNFDWNEFAKRKNKMISYKWRDVVLSRISNIFFFFGFIVASTALLVVPKPYNIVIFSLYIVILILRKVGIRTKKRGTLTEKMTGEPLSFGIVRVLSAESDREISHAVADKIGHFYCLVQNGHYRIKIEKKNLDGKYTVVYTNDSIVVKDGVLNMDFAV